MILFAQISHGEAALAARGCETPAFSALSPDAPPPRLPQRRDHRRAVIRHEALERVPQPVAIGLDELAIAGHQYIAYAEGVSASVSLQQVSPEHALAAIAPCDNVFVVRSEWYGDNPLVLKGPGAGRVVTAGGLHTDLAQLIKRLYGATVSAA